MSNGNLKGLNWFLPLFRILAFASAWSLGALAGSGTLWAELREVRSGEGWKLLLDVRPESPELSEMVTLSVVVDADHRLILKEPIYLEFPHSFQLIHGPVPLSGSKPGDAPSADTPADGMRNQRSIHRWEYRLSPLTAGELTLPRIVVPYSIAGSQNEDAGMIAMPETTIQVTSLLDGQQVDLKEIDLLPQPMLIADEPRVWPWVVGGLGAVALLYVAYRGRRWLSRGVGATRRSIEGIAESQLNELEREKLPAAGRSKEYVSRLTGIVRGYVEAKTGLSASDRTTEEFLASIRQDDRISLDVKSRLREFLETADLVKFAGQSASYEIVDRSFASARSLIRPELWSRFQNSPSEPSQDASHGKRGE